MAPPTTIKAIVAVEGGKMEIRDVALPRFRADYVLVKVKAVGLNLLDWERVPAGIAPPGARLGTDYAGVVEQVGPAVTKDFERGDRIAGVVRGGDVAQPENGAFAEWIVAKGDLQIKIPDNLSYVEAATLGRSICTVGQGLYRSLELPLPPGSVRQNIMIYGSETATGRLGIQFARLSGLAIITISPKQEAQFVASLGANCVFNYEDGGSCALGIRQVTSGSLRLAWDCTGLGAEVCAASLSTNWLRDQPVYATAMPVDREQLTRYNEAVRGPVHSVLDTVFGERFVLMGQEMEADPDEYDFAKQFWELTRRLLESGDVKPCTPEVNRGGEYGLEGVLLGLDDLRSGRGCIGTKLVYQLPG
ncbi:hypothetical protein PG985_007236 [Apiospora marii]|uniref:Enoyl reductase (ER) domain-containing protein n=1 Tax=Apiospora marii TaxID=335849 RepID=A0ABR1SH07_9PEZI